jgi:sialate O-acetylesterase
VLPAALLLASPLKQSALKLSPLFQDGAVLQRGIDVPVFGFAAPGSFVNVEINGQRAGATADAKGKWMVRMKPLPTGGPYTLSASSNGETVSARDLLSGEVWIASGQSNMELPESVADDYERAKSEARADIRMFTVEKATANAPLNDLKGHWDAASANTVGKFSAVGWSFARELSRRLNVPIGIIHTSWGGTPAEAWTSREALSAKPALKPMVDNFDLAQKDYPTQMDAYKKAMGEFINFKHGSNNEGFMNNWQAAEFDDSAWQGVAAGTLFPDDFDGAAWYRKTVDVPAEWVGKELTLTLGAIDDYDTTYFDGIRVGRTGVEDDNGDYSTPRKYRIAPGIVRAGKNVISVRVFDNTGPGGITGPVSEMKLSLADGSASIPLDGSWRFKIERALDPKTQIPARPFGLGNPNVPMTLYNAMIAPIVPYGIKGAIWYQGESNVDRAMQYRELFPTMIRDWRARWGEGPFPFYFVQLANYMARKPEPSESQWAELREAQTMTLSLPNTGMALAIDIGEAGDIHPKNKREVGRRLALNALGRTYRQPVIYEGPSYSGMTVIGDTIHVTFKNGALETTDKTAPRSFQIAGEDRKWAWADARIDGSTVILRANGVTKPVAVRYGWADNPDVNLVNRAGLPAVPFRTDAP